MKTFPLSMACMILCSFLCGCGELKKIGIGNQEKQALAQAVLEGYATNTIKGIIKFHEEKDRGLVITGTIEGLLPESSYAIHILESGSCDSSEDVKDFDPGNSEKHGAPWMSPGQHHAGDLPNIKAGGNGKADIDISTYLIDVSDSSSFSILNRTIVLFSHSDDFRTQPNGNVGQRIGCGKIISVQ